MTGELSREKAFDRSGTAWVFIAFGAATSVLTRLTGEEMAFAVFSVAFMVACAVLAIASALYGALCCAMYMACFLLRRELPERMPLMHLWDEKLPLGLKDALAVVALATAAFALGMFVAFAILMF